MEQWNKGIFGHSNIQILEPWKIGTLKNFIFEYLNIFRFEQETYENLNMKHQNIGTFEHWNIETISILRHEFH